MIEQLHPDPGHGSDGVRTRRFETMTTIEEELDKATKEWNRTHDEYETLWKKYSVEIEKCKGKDPSYELLLLNESVVALSDELRDLDRYICYLLTEKDNGNKVIE